MQFNYLVCGSAYVPIYESLLETGRFFIDTFCPIIYLQDKFVRSQLEGWSSHLSVDLASKRHSSGSRILTKTLDPVGIIPVYGADHEGENLEGPSGCQIRETQGSASWQCTMGRSHSSVSYSCSTPKPYRSLSHSGVPPNISIPPLSFPTL